LRGIQRACSKANSLVWARRTGAIAQKIGRLERRPGNLASTRVSDIPMKSAQIAAPCRSANSKVQHADLVGSFDGSCDVAIRKMVESREFRSDLYARLNVFPIRIHSFAERPEIFHCWALLYSSLRAAWMAGE
jgi:formate hydrogenlyase transcriptional activator